jgi:hypothetical protein
MDCYGIEIVQERHQFAEEFVKKVRYECAKDKSVLEFMNRIHFSKSDCSKASRFVCTNGKDITHAYCFNYLYPDENIMCIAKALKKTVGLKMLAWLVNEDQTRMLGLTNVRCVSRIKMNVHGSKETPTLYVYKTDKVDNEEEEEKSLARG